jgi:4-hydroxy-tetrahydrodipicolinate synthase
MKTGFRLDRRTFLRSAAALGVSQAFAATGALAQPVQPRLSPNEFKKRLRGAIVSTPTPFTADFAIDYEGLRRMVRQDLKYGINIFELTYGDSQYRYLSYQEIKSLVRAMVRNIGGNGMLIAGSGPWWTGRAIEFVRYAQSVGASAAEIMLPVGGSEDGYVRHFEQIARHSRLPLVLRGNLSKSLMKRLVHIDSIVAMKQDVSRSYFVETLIHFSPRIKSYSGGSFEWFLAGQPYGAVASFDTYAAFAPEISVRFWKAVRQHDMAVEAEIVKKYDHPLISDEFSNPFWHATLEYFGVAKRYLRPPQHSYTDKEMAGIKAFFDKLGVFPH